MSSSTPVSHTPGPWEVSENEHGDQTRRFIWPAVAVGEREARHCDDTNYCIAIVAQRGEVATLEANARLIAAAPELVDALRRAIAFIGQTQLYKLGHVGAGSIVTEGTAALRKAGER